MEENDIPKVIDNSEINDIRTPTQFKGVTFSKFKKNRSKKTINRKYVKKTNRTSVLLVC